MQHLNNGGGTALYDAIYKACKDKLLREHSDHPIRKAIVVLSDGEDNQSEYTRAQAIEMAQRAEVLIYAISTDDSGLILRGDKVLEDLASATGGRAFFPYKMKDITHAFAAIEDELRSQYAVSYKPSISTPRPIPLHPDHGPKKRPSSARAPRILRASPIIQPPFRGQIWDPRDLFFSPMKASIAKRPALRGVSRSADSPTQVLLFDLVDEG